MISAKWLPWQDLRDQLMLEILEITAPEKPTTNFGASIGIIYKLRRIQWCKQ